MDDLDIPEDSHRDIMLVAENKLNSLIENDPLLQSLPSNVTVEELNSLLALEHGRAISVTVWKADDDRYNVVVDQDGTVLDLKKAIRYNFTMKQTRKGINQLVSWKYVWKKYWLYYEGQKLTPDNCKLKEFGVRNGSNVTFMKRLKEKQ